MYSYKGNEIYPLVEVYPDIVPAVGGVNTRDYFLDPIVCADAYIKARDFLIKRFEGRLPVLNPIAPPTAYGHPIAMGAKIIYPEHGEPNMRPIASNIDDAIEFMREHGFSDGKPGYWENLEPIATRIEFCETMSKRLGMPVPFSGMGYEGPMTSAVLLRGQEFFEDIYDEPEKALEFLTLVTDSVTDYVYFLNRMTGKPQRALKRLWMCDDMASMIAPDMWDDFVIPFWNKHYSTLGVEGIQRVVHCEGMRPAHLPKLKNAEIWHYQPSVSSEITLEAAIEGRSKGYYEHFDFLLPTFHISCMSDEAIEAWVDTVVKADVEKVRTQFGEYMFKADKLDRIDAFYKACEKYKV